MMKLIIFYTGVMIDFISAITNKARIPLLSNMQRISAIIKLNPTIVRIRANFNKLLSPIQEYSCNDHNKTILPIDRTFNKYRNQDTQNTQCKKMPPYKLQSLFGVLPKGAYVSHCVPPYLHDQANTDCCKNIPIKTFNGLNFMCPVFNTLSMLEGGERRESI